MKPVPAIRPAPLNAFHFTFPFQIREKTHAPLASKTAGFTLVELLVVIAIIGVLVALLLPAVQSAREVARRSECQNKLKQLALGMHNHHDTYRLLPAGATFRGGTVSPNKLGYAWAIPLLPFIEQAPLFDQYRSVITDVRLFACCVWPVQARNTIIPAFICPYQPSSADLIKGHSGNVTYDGQPVEEGEILFSVGGFAREASPITGGRFRVRVPPGPAKVVVRAYRPMSSTDSASITATDVVMENYLPAKYNEKSDLTIEVARGMAPIELHLSPWQNLVPFCLIVSSPSLGCPHPKRSVRDFQPFRTKHHNCL